MTNPEHSSNRSDEPDPNILLCEDNDSYRICLRLGEKGMKCLAEVEVHRIPDASGEQKQDASPACLGAADLIRYLKQVNIVNTIDYEAVYELCAAIELRKEIEPVVVARGVDPLAGTDGWFELQVRTGEEGGAPLIEDEKGSVDFKNASSFSGIESGQKLGVVHPPTEGIPGMTVHGIPVPAPAGKAFELIAGDGVILKYHDRVAFAEKSGRALLEKQTLAVVDQWIIDGDVDMKVGNIDFNGFVEIKGEVFDSFHVRATKGIKIHGHAGACTLESGGSIELVSMGGKNIGEITCHGHLKAKFLNQVTAVVFGSVFVSSEIRNSLVKSTGRIIVERGSIIGGQCISLEGIQAKNLGCSSGLRTNLTAGIYFPDVDRFEYLWQRQETLKRQLAKLKEGIGHLQKSLARNVSYAAAAEKRLEILSEQHDKLIEEKNRLSAEINASKSQEFSCQNAKINVQSKLMEGVVLTLGISCEEIKMARSGPLSIIENTREGGLRFLKMSAIELSAEEIERTLLETFVDSLPEKS